MVVGFGGGYSVVWFRVMWPSFGIFFIVKRRNLWTSLMSNGTPFGQCLASKFMKALSLKMGFLKRVFMMAWVVGAWRKWANFYIVYDVRRGGCCIVSSPMLRYESLCRSKPICHLGEWWGTRRVKPRFLFFFFFSFYHDAMWEQGIRRKRMEGQGIPSDNNKPKTSIVLFNYVMLMKM